MVHFVLCASHLSTLGVLCCAVVQCRGVVSCTMLCFDV